MQTITTTKLPKVRVWPSIEMETHAFIDELAQKERRTVSEMAAILIENAVKERQRKRKDAKEDQV